MHVVPRTHLLMSQYLSVFFLNIILIISIYVLIPTGSAELAWDHASHSCLPAWLVYLQFMFYSLNFSTYLYLFAFVF